MAIVKDLIVNGVARFINDSYFNTIKAGTWNGSTIGVSYGGTGKTSVTSGYLLVGNGTSAMTERQIVTSLGTSTSATTIPTAGAVYTALSNLTPSGGGDGKIPFGKVNSTSTSTAFTATVSGITELTEGVCCYLMNGAVTSASGCTLNINNLGAKPIYHSLGATSGVSTHWNVNYTALFVYNTTRVSTGCWDMYLGWYSDSNSVGYQIRYGNAVLPVSDTARYYKIYFTSADGTKWVPASVNSTNDDTSARPVNQRPIDPFGKIVYTSANTNYTEGTNLASATAWEQYTCGLGYSFNRTGAALVLQYPKPVYIKCHPQADGSAIIDADEPYVQALPSTEDGLIYIFLGVAYGATGIELMLNHPVYCYKNGTIQQWTGLNSLSTALLYEPDSAVTTPTLKGYLNMLTANRLALLPPSQVIIEQTTDGGTTWTAHASATDNNKKIFFRGTNENVYYTLPKINNAPNKLCGLRITFTAMQYTVPSGTTEPNKYSYWTSANATGVERHCRLDGLYVWVQVTGSGGALKTRVYRSTGGAPNTWVAADRGRAMYLTGNPGGNYISLEEDTFGGGSTSNTGTYWNYRIEFYEDGVNGGDLPSSGGYNVMWMQGFGPTSSTSPNWIMLRGMPYLWNSDMTLRINNGIIPETTEVGNLGSSDKKWNTIYAKTVTSDNLYTKTQIDDKVANLPINITNPGSTEMTDFFCATDTYNRTIVQNLVDELIARNSNNGCTCVIYTRYDSFVNDQSYVSKMVLVNPGNSINIVFNAPILTSSNGNVTDCQDRNVFINIALNSSNVIQSVTATQKTLAYANVYSGSSTPSNSTGDNGDIYLQTS